MEKQILPLAHCIVKYFHSFLTAEESKELYNELIERYHLPESRLVIEAGGRSIRTDSIKILFTTEELLSANHYPEEIHGKVYVWQGLMLNLKKKVEELLEHRFDVAMCIYYPDGNYYAPYHFDQQTSGVKTIIPSLSLGEERIFTFKNNTSKESYSLRLGDGSILVMEDYCQSRYTHSLPQDPMCSNGRINITFREPQFK